MKFALIAVHCVERVYFDIGEQNFRSRKAVEKLGAVECSGDDEKVVYCLSKNAFSIRAWGVGSAATTAGKQ